MFCPNCGVKIEDNAQFCQNCGHKTDDTSNGKSAIGKVRDEPPDNEALFYSEDWHRKKVFAVSSLPYFDVMADKEYLYLIEMPKYNGGVLGLFLGLIIFNIIGAIIGIMMGNSSDTKKRKHYRSAWVNPDSKLISHDYNRDIFLKMPLDTLKGNIVMGKNTFTLIQGEKKVVLQKSQKEFDRFSQYIKNYVL